MAPHPRRRYPSDITKYMEDVVDRKSERRNADNIIVKKIHSELIYVQKEG
jgi:hypothetical protein